MNLALCQINPTVGNISENTKKVISIIGKTKADLFVFPEMAITGYCPQDLILNRQFVERNLVALNIIAESMPKEKSAIIGFIDFKDGNRFNAAALLENGCVKTAYHKQCLPNYSVFDEKRWFSAGTTSNIFNFNDKKIGISICEDMWEQSFRNDTIDFFVNISASPYSEKKIKKIEEIVLKRNKETGKPIVYVNQVGSQDGLIYYGHSMFVKNGKITRICRDFEEVVLVVNI